MKTFANIAHKLKRDGFSQLDRENQSLSPSELKIDDRETRDLLQFLFQYARQINYFDDKSTNRSGDWVPFFKNSIPFQYAVIAAYDLNALDVRFEKLTQTINNRLTFNSLHLLFDLLFDISDQITQWLSFLQLDNSGLKAIIENLIQTNLSTQLLKLIQLANAQGKWGYKRAKNSAELQRLWEIKITDLYKIDTTFLKLRGSMKIKVLSAYAVLEELYRTFWKAFQNIIAFAKDNKQFEKSLANNDLKEHQPHLGLLFAFLMLFKKAQGGLNELSEAHLDFFYTKVLQLKNQPAIPDHAHLTFELAKKVEKDILIEKGTRFKAGKDKNGKEIFFTLDDELIVSKAKVADQRTLYIDRYVVKDENTEYSEDIKTVEGIYMAPVANSADGKGEQDFEKDKPPLWSTVGAKLSKWTDPDQNKEVAEDHPYARLGFMIASKILFLREGKRVITIDLVLDSDLSELLTTGLYKALHEQEKETESITLSELLESQFTKDGDEISFADILATYQEDTPLSEVFESLDSSEGNNAAKKAILDAIQSSFLPNDIFDIYLTTEEGWMKAGPDSTLGEESNEIVITPGSDGNTFSVAITLPSDFPAIISPDPKLLEVDYGYGMPMIQFDLNHEALRAAYAYRVLRTKNICRVDINVTVCDVRQLILQNDVALIDINKPFMPFGPLPKENSSNFYIGSEEIFCKRWEDIVIIPEWKDKPGNLNTHYVAYEKKPDSDNVFKATIELLSDKNWISNGDEVNLFLPVGAESLPTDPIKVCPVNPDETEDEDIKHFWVASRASFEINGNEAEPCDEVTNIQNGYLTDTTCGFLRLKLGDHDFLHDEYANTLIESIQNLTDLPIVKKELDKAEPNYGDVKKIINKIVNNENDIALPNAPYTPLIESLSVNYSASTNTQDHADEIKFTHLHPFHGTYEKLDIIKKEEGEGEDKKTICQPTLLPCFVDEGTLYIGLENYEPGSKINLLFHMEPASADPDMDKAVVCWDFLRNNSWNPLKMFTHVISDTTNGLIQSGIVQLSIPSSITSEKTTILPSNLHWVKARVLLRTAAISDSLIVKAHAIQATFKLSKENDLSRLSTLLEAGKIAKFETPLSGIKGVTQEYPGFGGRPKEASSTFYQRISEHLRHKGRAISIYDYERIILQQFEEIYKVKCISHTLGRRGQSSDYELAPGYVSIVVIPDLNKVNAVDPLQPKVPAATLEKIKQMLRERISPFVNLEVLNPIFETIKVEAEVKFKAGKSNPFYEEKLAEDVKAFLSPWAFSDTRKDISFGGNIYYSTILKFIEDRDYVEYLMNIKMKKNEENDFLEVITASNSRVVLTSNEQHKFTAIESDNQLVMANTPSKKGIGFSKIPKF